MTADPSSLHLAILRRNARLRAWRSAGVPVEGGWDLYEGYPYVTLRCAVCLNGTALDLADDYTPVEPWESADPYTQTEREAVRGFSHACPHLLPLLSPDPEEVLALTALELLATT